MDSLLSSKELYDSIRLGKSNSIRLLQVHGDYKDAFKNPIKCTLSEHYLSVEPINRPVYRCLSYVWGVKTGGSKIIVNEKFELHAGKNLIAFLERLRARNSGGYLWIDAICINQANTDERNAQVEMMGTIYAQASSVIVWLGWEWDRLGDASDNGTNELAETNYPEITEQDEHARVLLEAEVARNAAAESGAWSDEDTNDLSDTGPNNESSSGPCTQKSVQQSTKSEDPTEVAIAFIKILVPAFERWIAQGNSPWSDNLSKYGFDAPEMYLMLGIPRIRTKSWAALAHFLNRQWFQRAWIVQEAALAEKILIVCGFEVLQWNDIVKTCIFLQASGWFHRLMQFLDPTGIMAGPGYAGVVFASLQKICKLEHMGAELGNVIRSPFDASSYQDGNLEYKLLLFYLQVGRLFGATEKHDKVYAPLALLKQVRSTFATKWGSYTPQINLLPDYKRSAVDVYTEVAALTLQHTPDLTLLSMVEVRAGAQIERLPSWVPDFSNGIVAEFSGIPGLEYDAFPGTLNDVVYNRTRHTITLGCYMFDEVTEIDPGLNLSFETLFETKDFRPWIKHCLKTGDGHTQTDGETYVESMWRTMIGNLYGDILPAPRTAAASFKCYVQMMTATKLYKDVVDLTLVPYADWNKWSCFDDLRRAVPGCIDAIPSVEELRDFAEHKRSVLTGEPPSFSANKNRRRNENTAYSRLPELKSVSGHGYAYGLAVGRMYPMRRFFRTKKGYMGLAPRSAIAGDRVCFLSGGKTPFIMRQDPRYGVNDFKLLGECYLHGFMQGEILAENEKPVLEKVTIR